MCVWTAGVEKVGIQDDTDTNGERREDVGEKRLNYPLSNTAPVVSSSHEDSSDDVRTWTPHGSSVG